MGSEDFLRFPNRLLPFLSPVESVEGSHASDGYLKNGRNGARRSDSVANSMTNHRDLATVPAFASRSHDVNVIVDTPEGSGNKFKYDMETGLFALGNAMPVGSVFPFEFGFIPSPRGGDGDPVDVMILMDAPTFVGCLVRCRLIRIILAEQTEKRKTERNDRLIAVTALSRRNAHMRELRELPRQLLAEIEHFFISYNEIKGKKFNRLAAGALPKPSRWSARQPKSQHPGQRDNSGSCE